MCGHCASVRATFGFEQCQPEEQPAEEQQQAQLERAPHERERAGGDRDGLVVAVVGVEERLQPALVVGACEPQLAVLGPELGVEQGVGSLGDHQRGAQRRHHDEGEPVGRRIGR